MIINHNISAIGAQRNLKFVEWRMDNNINKLSSGMRINRASDDASGLAVSERMRSQIRGIRQAERNVEDGMSFIQTTEGYLQESTDLVQRIRELAVQAANGIYSSMDRTQIQVEVSQLVAEVDRNANAAQFNGMPVLNGRFAGPEPVEGRTPEAMTFQVGPNAGEDFKISTYVQDMRASALGLKSDTTQVRVNASSDDPNDPSGVANAESALSVADNALNLINKQRADLGAISNRLEHTARGLMVSYENLQASESRIRDVDMAEEMVDYVRNQVLTQSSTAMLAQANLKPMSVLQLLQ